jgi:hypothetical protein
MKEFYERMHLLAKHFQYDKYSGVTVQAERTTLLFGIQPGCIVFSCFLCEWDTRAWQSHYSSEKMATLTSIDSRAKRKSHPSTCSWFKERWLLRNSVKALNQNCSGFLLETEISREQREQNKGATSVVPQITDVKRWNLKSNWKCGLQNIQRSGHKFNHKQLWVICWGT